MAEDCHRLPGQVCGETGKCGSTVSFVSVPGDSLFLEEVLGRNRQGTTVEELHAHVREQQRKQERQKAVEAEATRSAERALKEQDIQRASTPRVQRPPGSSVRKDSSPIKVRPSISLNFVAVS